VPLRRSLLSDRRRGGPNRATGTRGCKILWYPCALCKLAGHDKKLKTQATKSLTTPILSTDYALHSASAIGVIELNLLLGLFCLELFCIELDDLEWDDS